MDNCFLFSNSVVLTQELEVLAILIGGGGCKNVSSLIKGGGGRSKTFYPVLTGGGGGVSHKFWTCDFPIL